MDKKVKLKSPQTWASLCFPSDVVVWRDDFDRSGLKPCLIPI